MTYPPLVAKRATGLDAYWATYDPQVTPFVGSDSGDDSVLFGALANNDAEIRFAITMRLMDDGADASVLTTGGTSVLHALLTLREMDPPRDAILLRRLLAGGAPVNLPDRMYGPPPRMLFDNYMVEDEDAVPLYEAFFERDDIDLDAPRKRGGPTVRKAFEMAKDNGPIPYEMMVAYEQKRRS